MTERCGTDHPDVVDLIAENQDAQRTVGRQRLGQARVNDQAGQQWYINQ